MNLDFRAQLNFSFMGKCKIEIFSHRYQLYYSDPLLKEQLKDGKHLLKMGIETKEVTGCKIEWLGNISEQCE